MDFSAACGGHHKLNFPKNTWPGEGLGASKHSYRRRWHPLPTAPSHPLPSPKRERLLSTHLNHTRGTEGQVCGSRGTVYNHRQLCLWGEAGAGQCPSSGFKISKAKDPEWLEQGHGIKAWKIDGGALKASCRSSTTRLRTEERRAAALGPQTAPEAQFPEAMRRVQGKCPLLRLSFPICTVGSVDWLQLPSKSFIKQVSLIVMERDI